MISINAIGLVKSIAQRGCWAARAARAIAAALILAPALAAAPASAAPVPTIVLVHAAFADPTSWDGVAAVLREDGYHVVAPVNPLCGPTADAAAVQRVLDTISGPVLLVGHSYGGAVISNVHDPKVESLVYIAAFAPAQGESTQLLLDPFRFPGSQLWPPVLQLRVVDDATGLAGKNIDGYIAPDCFNSVFAQDVDAATAADMVAHQRSICGGGQSRTVRRSVVVIDPELVSGLRRRSRHSACIPAVHGAAYGRAHQRNRRFARLPCVPARRGRGGRAGRRRGLTWCTGGPQAVDLDGAVVAAPLLGSSWE